MPDVRFTVAMNRDPEDRFKLFEKEALSIPNLDFLGMVPPAELDAWFRGPKILLNTSIREGFPNTFLQAWMNGVPVITLNIDPDGIIQTRGLGLVAGEEEDPADCFDYSRLANMVMPKIRELLTDKTKWEESSHRATQYCKKNHAPDIVVPCLVEALCSI